MVEQGKLQEDDRSLILRDAINSFPHVHRDSIETMVMTGRLLGYTKVQKEFPSIHNLT